jgi:hypothetical protein
MCGWSHSAGSVRKLWIFDMTRQSFIANQAHESKQSSRTVI